MARSVAADCIRREPGLTKDEGQLKPGSDLERLPQELVLYAGALLEQELTVTLPQDARSSVPRSRVSDAQQVKPRPRLLEIQPGPAAQ